MENWKARDWKRWGIAAGVRALKTMAQAGLSVIASCALLTEVNWAVVGSTIALSGVTSLLTSIKGLPELNENTE